MFAYLVFFLYQNPFFKFSYPEFEVSFDYLCQNCIHFAVTNLNKQADGWMTYKSKLFIQMFSSYNPQTYITESSVWTELLDCVKHDWLKQEPHLFFPTK